MVVIKCEKCGSSEGHRGTTMVNLGMFEANKEIRGWTCGDCINKMERNINQLKAENLGFKIQNQKRELTELINLTKNKLVREIRLQLYAGELGRVIRTEPDRELHNQLDILLESQRKCLKESNTSVREQLGKSKEFLEKRLTNEEIQIFLGKQVEINELEKQLESLQIKESKTEISPK